MPDLDRRFREASQIGVPDLWPEISTREPTPTPPPERWRRSVAVATALLVAAVAIGFAGWAFFGNGRGTPKPEAPTCTGMLEQVPHPILPSALGIEGLNGVTALGPDDAWAVGSSGFLMHGPSRPIDRARILHWDGTAWRPVAAPVIHAVVHDLMGTRPARGRIGVLQSVDGVSSNDVWAVGSAGGTLIEHWDGQIWARVPSPQSGKASTASLASVSAVAADDAWAVGSSDDGALILHWDGSRWSIVDLDAPAVPRRQSTELSAVVAVGPDEAWAAGTYFNEADDGYQVLMLRWDGSAWRQVRAPSVVPSGTTSVQALAATSSGDVWAVGSWSDLNAGGDPVHPLAEHWDGTRWVVVDTPPMEGDRYRFLNGVAAAAPDDVWAVGYRAELDTPAADRGPLIEHWDGVRWRDVGTDLSGRSLSAASALRTGEVWSVGAIGGQGTGGRGLIAHRSCAS